MFNFPKQIQLPNRRILILGAICLSVIVITLSQKAVESKKLSAQKENLLASAGQDEKSVLADERILKAIEEATIASLSASSSNPFVTSPNDTLSDRFSKNIVSAYAKYQSGLATEEQIANEVINDIDTSGAPKEKYTLAQVQIFTPRDKQEIKDYANNFAREFLSAIDPVAKDPGKYNSNINLMSSIYQDVAQRLIRIRVPNALAISHLKIVNSYQLQADSFFLISGQEKDPVKAFVGLSVMKNSAIDQQKAFTVLTEYIKQNGIIFSESEPGVFFGTNTQINTGTSTGATI